MLRLLLASCAAALLSAALAAGTAHAFGSQGHQIICAIAMKELTPTAAARVNGLMRQDTEYNTFWEACIWPDKPRRRRPAHFVNVPRTTAEIAGATCSLADECPFAAIESDAAIIGDRSQPKKKRREALKYLGHWVGDIHQPMHISFEDDRGGHQIRTSGLCSGNLHSNWDTCLVVRQTGTGNPNGIANSLRSTITDADRATWTTGGPADWAKESYAITIDGQSEYCERDGDSCDYDEERVEFSGGAKKKVVVDQAYVDANGPIVELQMKRGGGPAREAAQRQAG